MSLLRWAVAALIIYSSSNLQAFPAPVPSEEPTETIVVGEDGILVGKAEKKDAQAVLTKVSLDRLNKLNVQAAVMSISQNQPIAMDTAQQITISLRAVGNVHP
ncbi:MAG: hypothetical protein K2Y22_13820 [Candidatus Obscuribacterales bacterium]|nr:hypothetical protein [Candidatus Obscuribacterales bacterium]